jgi:hypothetical protein
MDMETVTRIFRCALAVAILMFGVACHEARDSVKPVVTPHVRQRLQLFVASLPPQDFTRQMVGAGRFGDGVRSSWMDAMKGQGVQAVTVRIRMTWFLGPHWPYATEVRYFSDYGGIHQVVDEGVLKLLRQDRSEDAVKRAALAHYPDGFWFELPHYRPFQAVYVVTLYEDEWLPIPRQFYGTDWLD